MAYSVSSQRMHKQTSTPSVSVDEGATVASVLKIAANRCFHVSEIIDLLSPGTTPLPISPLLPSSPPPSGALFLYNRSATRHYKQDGHDWVKKRISSRKASFKVREDDVKLRLNGEYRVTGLYARSAVGARTLRRRSYHLLDPSTMKPTSNLVLVHYLDEDEGSRNSGGALAASDVKSTDDLGERTSRSPTSVRRGTERESGGGDISEGLSSSNHASKLCPSLVMHSAGGGGDDQLETKENEKMSDTLLKASFSHGSDRGDDRDMRSKTAAAPNDDCKADVEKCDVAAVISRGSGATGDNVLCNGMSSHIESPALTRVKEAVAPFLAAPKMTNGDIEKEWSSSTEMEKSEAIADIYGSAVVIDARTSANPDDFNGFATDLKLEVEGLTLLAMQREIDRIPRDAKSGFLGAMQHCPRLASSINFRLQFLRCEENCPRAAALRFVTYWTKRVEIFGRDHAFTPITLEGAMTEDFEDPGFGHARLLPGTDVSGRGVIFLDGSSRGNTTTELRSLWYMAQAAAENESIRKNGLVFILFSTATLETQDKRDIMEKQCLMRDALPLRFRAFHICRFDTESWFYSLIGTVARFMAGKHMRARLVYHDGSKERVLLQLNEFGISRSQLPSQIGGAWTEEDFRRWLTLRREAGN